MAILAGDWCQSTYKWCAGWKPQQWFWMFFFSPDEKTIRGVVKNKGLRQFSPLTTIFGAAPVRVVGHSGWIKSQERECSLGNGLSAAESWHRRSRVGTEVAEPC